MARELVDYYDREKYADDLSERKVMLERENKAVKLILDNIPRGKILDVGCGDGLFLDHLRDVAGKKTYKYCGVDYSQYNVDVAITKGFDVKKCDIEEGIPFSKASFDLVYAAELIEHVVNPDYFLEECHRLLKPGGSVIISTPNLTAWYNRLMILFGMHPMFVEFSTKSPTVGSGVMKGVKKASIPVGHIRIFTVNALTDLLDREGFKVEVIKGSNFGALPGPLKNLDSLIANVRPKISSNIIIMATKR